MARLKRISWLLMLVVFPACVSPLSVPSSRRPQGIFHSVKRGENLFRIGKAYDVPYRELARINGIRDPGGLRVGQRIFIPGATRRLPVEIITPADVAPHDGAGPDGAERASTRFVWPVRGTVSSRFGPRGESFHDGIDISVPEGTPIRAIEQGQVIYSDQLRGYGNLVIVRHSVGYVSVYSHNRVNRVREGQKVEQGQVIGEVGSTGRVSGPHLHFEIRKDEVARNPLRYLPSR